MSRHMNKILVTALLAALLIAPLVAYIPKAQASPTEWKAIYIKLVDQLGAPIKCKEVIVILWNTTFKNASDCLLIFYRNYTGCDGTLKIPLNLPGKTLRDNSGGLYNFTIILVEEIGGKTYYFLLNWTYDAYPDGVKASVLTKYFNTSSDTPGIIKCYHYWNIRFKVLDNCTDEAPYYTDPYLGKTDKALVKVYFPDSEGEVVFSKHILSSAGYTPYFNFSDTIVELATDECHIKSLKNVTLYKEIYWSWDNILIGKEKLEFVSYLKDDTWPLGWKPVQPPEIYMDDLVLSPKTFDPKTTYPSTTNDYKNTSVAYEKELVIEERVYTKRIKLELHDICDNFIEATTLIKVALQFNDITVREAQSINGTIPLPEYKYLWVPNVVLVYGKNYTLQVVEEGLGGGVRLPIYTGPIPPTKAQVDDWKKCTDVLTYTVKTSIFPVRILVLDSEPIPQPLVHGYEGIEVKVVIEGPWGTLETNTGAANGYVGYVILPPWTPEARKGNAPEAKLWPSGYLVLPYGTKSAEYHIKIYFKAVGGTEFVDVTDPENATIKVTAEYDSEGVIKAIKIGETSICDYDKILVVAKVYQVKLKLVSLCNEPLSSKDYPDAELVLVTEDGVTIAKYSGIPEDGTVYFPKIPAGVYKLKLYWKCRWLEPTGTLTVLNVTDNINDASKATFTFPVRNLAFQLLSWNPVPGKEGVTDANVGLIDGYQAICGLNATIVYGCDYKEPWATSNCTGWVEFKKVPVGVNVTLVVYTWNTPYTRYEGAITGLDNNILVFEKVINVKPEPCLYTEKVHVWIYSFYMQAETCTGEVLKSFQTADGKWYNVTVIICDTTWQKEEAYCKKPKAPSCPTCAPEIGKIIVDFRIMNVSYAKPYLKRVGLPTHVATTEPEAKFLITSAQWDPAHPHLFVAGARYTVKVFYGGVLVYNYTFKLPRPDKDVTYIFNETYRLVPSLLTHDSKTYNEWDEYPLGAIKVVEEYDYKDSYNWLYHPILTVKGVSEGEYPVIELRTWVIPLKVWTWTKSYGLIACGKTPDHEPYLIPGLRLKLTFENVLENTFTVDYTLYSTLCDDAESGWGGHETSYVIAETDADLNGYITVLVPVWLPRYKAAKHFNGISFGNKISKVEVYAVGGITPGIPGDKEEIGPINEYYDCDAKAWMDPKNHPSEVVDPEKYYPPWNISAINKECITLKVLEPYKETVCDPEKGCVEVTKYKETKYTLCAGPTWCGVMKNVSTTCLECFAVQVYGYDLCGTKVPVAYQKVIVKINVTVDNNVYLGIIANVTKKTTDPIKLEPTTEEVTTPFGKVKKIVAEGEILPVFAWIYEDTSSDAFYYRIEVFHDIAAILKDKGYPVDYAKKFCLEAYLGKKIMFENKHNCGKEPITFEWKAILIDLKDIANVKPLPNMTVVAVKVGTNLPCYFDITSKDGKAVLLVDEGTYIVQVYWKDTLFAEIPIKIFDSFTDQPNAFMNGVVNMKNEGPVTTKTIEAYVYALRLRLVKADGKTPLKKDNIWVLVEWPDGTKTIHDFCGKCIAGIAENKDTRLELTSKLTLEDNPESCSRVPIGTYKVTVYYIASAKEGEYAKAKEAIKAGKVVVIGSDTVTVEKMRLGTASKVVDIKCDIYDFTVTVVTPWGTPLAGAKVKVEVPATGETIEGTLDETGSITLTDIAKGEVKITVTEWKNVAVNWETTVTYTAPKVVCSNIGKLVIKTVGARGQPLDAAVTIKGVTTATAKEGVLEVELPAGNYEVTVEYGGKKATETLTVEAGKVTEKTFQLDIFIQLAGWPMTLPEFFGFILLIVFIIIALFLLMHEYSVWRRKRLAKALVQAKPAK